MNGGRGAGARSSGVKRPSPGAPVARLSPRGAPPSPARGEGSLRQGGARGADASEKNSDELNEQTDEAENLRGNPQKWRSSQTDARNEDCGKGLRSGFLADYSVGAMKVTDLSCLSCSMSVGRFSFGTPAARSR